MEDLGALFEDGEGPANDQMVTIVDLAELSAPPLVYDAGATVDDLSWATPTELVLVTPTELVAVEVPDITSRPVAELFGPELWSLASAADTC